jgi:Tol biopolymer transport system component
MKKSLFASLVLGFLITMVSTVLHISPAHAATQTTYINGKLAYVDMSSGNAIWTRNGDGSNPVKILSGTALIESPSWSPNGQKLVYSSDIATPGTADIYVMNADGTSSTNISNDPTARDETPSWSPDGTKIAFVSDRGFATANYRLWIMNADGSGQTAIYSAASQGDRFPNWSPDSSTIYYSSVRSGVEQTYAYNVNTQTDTQFSHISTTAIEPAVSPDGTKILFAHAEPSDSKIQLYTENADGTNLTKLFGYCTNGYSQWPSWSPDGKKVMFISNCDTLSDVNNLGNVYTVNIDGTGLQRITTLPDSDWTPTSWQRVPVTSSTPDPTTGGTDDQVSDNHSDTDYEVYDKDHLSVDGQVGNIIVHTNGTLSGHGSSKSILVQQSGHLAPGNSPGCFSSTGLTMNTGSILDEQIGGTTACSGYDQTNVTGSVTLTSPTLNATLYGGFVPAVGDAFTIINNDGSDPVSGTFNGLAEGASFVASGVTYRISYVGGSGNDVVLSVTAVNPAVAAAASSAPKAPNTGFAFVKANPVAIFIATILISGLLLIIARRLNFNH